MVLLCFGLYQFPVLFILWVKGEARVVANSVAIGRLGVDSNVTANRFCYIRF